MNKNILSTEKDHPIFSIIPENFTFVNAINDCKIYTGTTDKQKDGLKQLLIFHSYRTIDEIPPDYVRLIHKEHLCVVSYLQGNMNIVIYPDKETYNQYLKSYFEYTGEENKYKIFSID